MLMERFRSLRLLLYHRRERVRVPDVDVSPLPCRESARSERSEPCALVAPGTVRIVGELPMKRERAALPRISRGPDRARTLNRAPHRRLRPVCP